jgi:hypothetical protein
MFTWTDVWAGMLVPAGMTAGVLIAGWRLARHAMSARDSRSWAGPIATGAGFAAGYLALFGWPGFPPAEAADWLVFLALPLAALGLVAAYLQMAMPLRAVLLAIAVPAVLWILARPLLTAREPMAGDTFARLMIASGAGVVSLVALDGLSGRASALRQSAILLAAAVPAAAALVLAGSLRYAEIAAILAASEAGALAAYLVLGHAALARGSVFVVGTLLGGLLWCGHSYADLATSDALLLAAAPNMAWLAYLVPWRIGRLGQTVLQLILVAGVAGAAVARAWTQTTGEAI